MMNNRQLAEAFTMIADLLEIKGREHLQDPRLPQSRRQPVELGA